MPNEKQPHAPVSGTDADEGQAGAALIADRRAKVAGMRERGVDPYPHSFTGVRDTTEVRASYVEGDESTAHRVAGRLVARRDFGRAAFLDIEDMSGTLQLYAREDILGESVFADMLDFDLGDFVGADGVLFTTRKGQLALRAKTMTLLAKSLRPPPSRWHGLQDPETRVRQREAYLMSDHEARARYVARARAISAIRATLDVAGFIEVETPVLQPLYGGAEARPFVTHHNSLDRDFYLRIATELYLKRLVVGGLQRVYEIGKNFRNEGISSKHNPEFTGLELYEAYADYNTMAERCEQIVAAAASAIGYSGDLEFTPPWPRVTYSQAILSRTGIDILATRDVDSLRSAVAEAGLSVPDVTNWSDLVDALVSAYVEPHLQQPTILIDYPIEIPSLAKEHRTHPGLVERFEAYCRGMEIANAYTELNDPDQQRARFVTEYERMAGDDEPREVDEAFMRALEYGMPPTGGIGIGIDRLLMVLTDVSSIRDVILFPAVR